MSEMRCVQNYAERVLSSAIPGHRLRRGFFAYVALGAVILAASALYFESLGEAPVHVGVDEARFAIRAQSLAATGRSIDGTRLPLFFHITNPIDPREASPTWWQPTLFYLMAAVFRVAGFSEWTTRLPTTVIAILNLCLIYAVGRRLFSNAWYGVLAALLLALTPAHFMFARQAQDYLCLLPVSLVWLLCLIRSTETDSRSVYGMTGAILGFGCYCHISAWLTMPLYLAVTMAVLWWSGKPLRALVPVVAGFTLPLLPILPWLWFHPGLPRDMIANYKVVSGFRLVERVEVFWAYFSPSFLFFSGGSNPMFGTRRAGVFPLAAIVLLPLGISTVLRRDHSLAGKVVLLGFLCAPVPIVLALPEDPMHYTPRDLLVVPYGILLCTAAVQWLVSQRQRWMTAAAVALVATVPYQFVSFANNYFTEYQRWSAYRFDALNLRAVAAYVIASDNRTHLPAVYLSEDVGEAQAHQWVFQLLRQGRPDLWERTKRFQVGRFNPNDIPAGSLIVVSATHPGLPTLQQSPAAVTVEVIDDVTGSPAAAVLRRN